jgi:hypothetical protein
MRNVKGKVSTQKIMMMIVVTIGRFFFPLIIYLGDSPSLPLLKFQLIIDREDSNICLSQILNESVFIKPHYEQITILSP